MQSRQASSFSPIFSCEPRSAPLVAIARTLRRETAFGMLLGEPRHVPRESLIGKQRLDAGIAPGQLAIVEEFVHRVVTVETDMKHVLFFAASRPRQQMMPAELRYVAFAERTNPVGHGLLSVRKRFSFGGSPSMFTSIPIRSLENRVSVP